MAVVDTCSSTIVLLLNTRTCSKDTDDGMDSRIKCLSDSGGPVAASITKAPGGGKWDELVTLTPQWAGVDGLRRPSGHAKTAGGLVWLVVRRGAPSDVKQLVKPMENNASGMPKWYGLCDFQHLAQPQCPGTYDSWPQGNRLQRTRRLPPLVRQHRAYSVNH